jgi:hypothetical protein
MSKNEDNIQYEKDPELLPGFKDLERTTWSGGGIRDVSDITTNFRNKVSDGIQLLTSQLSSDQIEAIKQNIHSVPNPQFKNPYAYILGYIGSQGGRDVTRESIKKAMEGLTYFILHPNERITVEDVIRYSIFWRDIIARN